MKRTIIIILVIVIIAVAYFLLVEKDVVKYSEIAPLVYPGAELIVLENTDFGTLSFYASDASLSKMAEFYEKNLGGFKKDNSFEFGYRFYDPELAEFMEEGSTHMSDEEIIDWVRDNEGVTAEIYLLSDDTAFVN